MNQKELRRLQSFWQKQLRLQDWDIEVKVDRTTDSEVEGKACVSMVYRTSDITLYLKESTDDEDVEITLVHEMLHCYHHVTSGIMQTHGLLLEQGVEAAACALVQLRRKVQSSNMEE